MPTDSTACASATISTWTSIRSTGRVSRSVVRVLQVRAGVDVDGVRDFVDEDASIVIAALAGAGRAQDGGDDGVGVLAGGEDFQLDSHHRGGVFGPAVRIRRARL